MIHALLSLVTCGICLLIGLPWPVMLWPAAYYFGREMSQAEYRYIQSHGGKRANCPWYCGFFSSAWTAKSVIDCLLPWVVCIVAAVISWYVK